MTSFLRKPAKMEKEDTVSESLIFYFYHLKRVYVKKGENFFKFK